MVSIRVSISSHRTFKAGHAKAGQTRAGHSRAGHARAVHARAGQGRPRPCKEISNKNTLVDVAFLKYIFFPALAISDLLFVLTSIPRGVRVATQQTYSILYPFYKFFDHFAYTTSIYLTVTLIIERYLAFIQGSRAMKYFEKLGQHRIKWVIGFVISSTFLYNVPIMFEFTWDTENGNGVTRTELARNPTFKSVYKKWMFFAVRL